VELAKYNIVSELAEFPAIAEDAVGPQLSVQHIDAFLESGPGFSSQQMKTIYQVADALNRES